MEILRENDPLTLTRDWKERKSIVALLRRIRKSKWNRTDLLKVGSERKSKVNNFDSKWSSVKNPTELNQTK